MLKKLSVSILYPHLLGSFCFIFLLAPKYVTVAILFWVIFLIFGGIKKQIIFHFQKANFLWAALYLAYLVGCLYTNHAEIAQKYLEYKLSFIVFPFLFSFVPKEKIKINIIYIWFIIGVFVLSILGFIHSVNCGGSRSCFLTIQFSYIHHPTYFASFHLLAMVMAIYGYKSKLKYFDSWWIFVFVLVSFISQILSLSLAGIILLVALALIYSLYLIKKRFSRRYMILATIILPVVAYLFLTKTPQIEGEWNNAKYYAETFKENPEKFVKTRVYPFSGTETRLILWTASWNIIQKYPWGAGTGNVDEYLSRELNNLGQNNLAKQKYNPHNQFFQTFIELGWVGFLILMIVLGYYLFVAFKRKDVFLAILVFSLAFNSLFESMLQRQSGIVFYVFWICLFLTFENRKHIILESKSQ
jgi:O-antigen ligase